VLDEIEVLLPVLGFDVLQPASVESAPGSRLAPTAPTFVAEFKKAKARAVERGGEFVVLAESTALRRETPGIPKSVSDRRKALIDNGSLVPDVDPDLFRFASDASFGSPSGASAAVAGRSDNGHTTWLLEGDGRSYAAWRASQLATAERAGA
jgi:Domain of unknown function (DUF4357)